MPKALARTHRKHGTPWVALVLGGCLYALLTGFSVTDLLVLEMWMFSALYILIYLALWRIRSRPDLDRGAVSGDYRFIIPAGRRGIWWVILRPMSLIVMAVLGSATEYLRYGGPVLLSGPILYAAIVLFRRKAT